MRLVTKLSSAGLRPLTILLAGRGQPRYYSQTGVEGFMLATVDRDSELESAAPGPGHAGMPKPKVPGLNLSGMGGGGYGATRPPGQPFGRPAPY